MLVRLSRWLTPAVIIYGVILRLALAWVTPSEWAHDNHYRPVQILLETRRPPGLAECWECYQPPLFYLVSALPYAMAERFDAGPTVFQQQPEGLVPRPGFFAGKAVQFVSVAAGGLTLWFAWRILRRVVALPPWMEAICVGVVAVLPEHVYMSAMATNDALTYLLAAIAIDAALRAHARESPCSWLAAGGWAGAALLSKIYGLVTVAAIGISAGWDFAASFLSRRKRAAREVWIGALRRAAIFIAAVLLIGIWPTVRTFVITDKLHADNFDFFDTPMRFQPPRFVSQVEFFTFRFTDLLEYPWVHMSHAASFWTELYARFWFDYEGFHTVNRYAPWQKMWDRAALFLPEWNRDRYEALLSYSPDEMPPDLAVVGAVSYVAGLLPTLLVLVGLVVALSRAGKNLPARLIALHLLLALAVPLAQTLRLPHFAAMKAAFALSAISSVPVLIAFVWIASRSRFRLILAIGLAVCVVALAVSNAYFAAWFVLNPALSTSS